MAAYLSHMIDQEHLVMSAERTMFWENELTLIVADVHVGKTGHFRKAGIGVPQNMYKDDLHRLLAQILFFKAERLVIVGDLTHSLVNREMDLFRKWRKDFSSLDVHLVKGNHDILDDKWYSEADIAVSKEKLLLKNFLFVHDILKKEVKADKRQYIFFRPPSSGYQPEGPWQAITTFSLFLFCKKILCAACIQPVYRHL